MKVLRRIWVVPATAFILFGCSDDKKGPSEPSGPEPAEPAEVQFLLSCEATLSGDPSISCIQTDPAAGGGTVVNSILDSDPNAVVHVESSYLRYEGGVLSADVSIRNNLLQALGTSDGQAADAEGVRVFFATDPVVAAGSGNVSVRNADGAAEFDGSNRPFFRYEQAISSGRSAFPKNWELDVDATVESFTFDLAVVANVADGENLTPGPNLIISTISADSLHTCVVHISGQPYCWGYGASGRLGNRNVLPQRFPVEVITGGHKFATVEVGLAHSCALTVEGEAWCWGSGSNGRLGDGLTSSVNTPVRVFTEERFIQMAVGRTHTCALSTEGKAFCWGGGANGKLGLGSSNDSHFATEVLGGRTYKWLSSGSFHTCAIETTGDAYCWGSATNGKRGDGSTSGTTSQPGLVSGGHKFEKIFAGEQHTCALKADGEAWCWGRNVDGQLGRGNTTSSSVPVQVAGGHRFVTLGLGYDYTCGVATTGKAYCWGNNAFGKLGHGSDVEGVVDVPTEVVGVENFTAIDGGIYHTCGTTLDGRVYCWGTAENGRLGTGQEVHTATPVEVTSLSGIAFFETPAQCGADSADCFQRQNFEERINLALEAASRAEAVVS